jgi:hypothetical protein
VKTAPGNRGTQRLTQPRRGVTLVAGGNAPGTGALSPPSPLPLGPPPCLLESYGRQAEGSGPAFRSVRAGRPQGGRERGVPQSGTG